jgi:hypothetical protein
LLSCPILCLLMHAFSSIFVVTRSQGSGGIQYRLQYRHTT